MRHREPKCAIERHRERLADRDWHCCECGWPNRPCLMSSAWALFRAGQTTASSPRCGDDATPYLQDEVRRLRKLAEKR
jgi:hypothetical protein